MKTYQTTLLILLTISLLQGCSGHALQDLIDDNNEDSSSEKASLKNETKLPPPSQNSALQSISPSITATDDHAEYRYIQQNTNEWLEKEWDPLTETNASSVENGNSFSNNMHKSDSNKTNESLTNEGNTSSGLQYYVDKAGIYLDNKEKRDANKTKEPSHVDKVNAMPGIGKKTTR